MISINTLGKILEGEAYVGWYVYIQSLGSKNEGYLILVGITHPLSGDNQEGYDDWVQDYDAVVEYFQGYRWKVEWQD
jgi:hypothetical protein